MPEGSATILNDVAQRIQAVFTEQIGATRFGLWFPPNARFCWAGHELLVRTRNDHFQEWAADQFGAALEAAVVAVCGRSVPVRFVTDPDAFIEPELRVEPSRAHAARPLVHTTPRKAPARPQEPAEERQRPKSHRRWRSFDDFIVGASNRVAAAAAQSVIEEPGMGPNPLVIHGPVGTGKTHLLEAIYAGLRTNSHTRPLYVTADEFTSKYVQATRYGKMSTFHRRFRDCPGLLFDDLHQLANRRGSADEFQHTLDSLVLEGRMVVVTMDCHPRLMDDLPTGLVDRLMAGTAWGLLPPDEANRYEILKHKSLGSISEEVLRFLAKNMSGNVRELEGAVNNLRHYARVTGEVLNVEAARDVVGHLLRQTVRAITLSDIETAVCTVLRMAPNTLQSSSRAWAISHPRMIAIFLARKHSAATYSEIAKHFGVKQHSSAVASEKRVREWLEKSERLTLGERSWAIADIIERIERELQR